MLTSRKHAYIILTPLSPTFLGFTGEYIIFFSAQNHRVWVLVRTHLPRRFSTNYVLSRNMKNVRIYIFFFFFFFVKIFSLFQLACFLNENAKRILMLYTYMDLPMSEQCRLFHILVGSILNYSSEVWGMHDAKDIEVIHTKFCRWILNVKKSTNLSALYGELGRVPFIIQRKFNMIKYWVKLLKSNDSFLQKKIYRILKDDADSGNSYNGSNWASYIKSLLDNLGLSYIWLQQGEIDIPLQLIKQRIFLSLLPNMVY